MKQIVIIGGGASGIFAAINAARLGNGNSQVIVLEKSNQLLSKVKISGGGRCNVTHSCFEPKELVKNYPRGHKELLSAFFHFNPTHTVEWFESRNVKLKTEEDGRMFPVTNDSQTIIDCLLAEAKKYDVDIKTSFEIEDIEIENNQFIIKNKYKNIVADKLLIAAGGNALGALTKKIKEWKHTMQPAIPSLFTFNIPNHPINELSGIGLEKVEVILPEVKQKMQGAFLFTHWGISGPAVLKLSAFAAIELFELKYQFKILLNFVPELNANEVKEMLLKAKQNQSKQKVCSNPLFFLPKRLWLLICEQSNIPSTLNFADLNKNQLEKLLQLIISYPLQANGKATYKDEFVTCGGVTLNEINFKTMESKTIPNLFFAGEIINVDGITGGFNFQNAWTTGMIAAENMIK
jgi:predicted Rossmann fold flavoprotein